MDTREKKNEHIIQYFDKHGIAYERKKLDVCDYTAQSNIWIERKQNLLELAGNIIKEHGRRIKAEFIRVPPGAKVYVLIEEDIGAFKNVTKWRSDYVKLSGVTLYKHMIGYQKRHNLQYVFCDKAMSGRWIAELLEVQHGK